MKLLFFALLFVGVLFEATADVLFKKWSLDNNSLWFSLGLALYLLSTVAWAYSLHYEHLSKAVTIFAVCNLIAIVLAGVYFFGEELTLTNKAGILLGIAAVALLQI